MDTPGDNNGTADDQPFSWGKTMPPPPPPPKGQPSTEVAEHACTPNRTYKLRFMSFGREPLVPIGSRLKRPKVFFDLEGVRDPGRKSPCDGHNADVLLQAC